MLKLEPLVPRRAVLDYVKQYELDISLGEEISKCPLLLEYLRTQAQELMYQATHLQPAVETDREVAFALTVTNAKLHVLETLYSFAALLPVRLDEYVAFVKSQQQSQE